MATAKNVLGGPLETCSVSPMTGFYRDGCCNTGRGDVGLHIICAEVTEEFLEFSLSSGNDLVSPVPLLGFPGLKPGDRWCLCAERWKEALEAGVAPPVVLAATHISALEFVDLEDLKAHAREQRVSERVGQNSSVLSTLGRHQEGESIWKAFLLANSPPRQPRESAADQAG